MSDVEELSYAKCRGLLAGGVFGRVGICTADGPRIFPVNYSVVGETILFRTSPDGLVASHDWRSPLAFEVDYVDHFVWVVTDGKASRRQVGIGVRSPGFVEITSGVDAGEQVVVGGQERLAEGAPVAATVVERGPVAREDSGRKD